MAAGNQYAAFVGLVVAGVENVPRVVERHFGPRGESHRAVRWWHVDVAEVASAVAGRNVEAAAECDGQVGEVAADANSGAVPI